MTISVEKLLNQEVGIAYTFYVSEIKMLLKSVKTFKVMHAYTEMKGGGCHVSQRRL